MKTCAEELKSYSVEEIKKMEKEGKIKPYIEKGRVYFYEFVLEQEAII